MKISTFEAASLEQPIGTINQTFVYPVGLTQGIALLPISENVIIKKIAINISTDNNSNAIKHWNFRIRGRNRDISLNTNIPGEIINPVSGPFNGSLLKNTDLDIVLNSKKNFIDFKNGIVLGGVSIVTFSYLLFSPFTIPSRVRILISVFYE